MRIGVDTGGTFTDFLALLEDGQLRARKLGSTPADPAQAVLTGIAALLGEDTPADIVHATTVGTNTILERSGGPTALVTTAGFEDLLFLRRQNRPSLYALHPRVPPPLCQDEHCLGVAERLDARGQVLRAPDPADLLALRERLAGMDVASVAVVLLHSYLNDSHEQAVAAALRPLRLPISLSSIVLPAHREYERAEATVADAYVAPRVGAYLRRLDTALASRRGARLRVMHSAGGAISASEAAAVPVRTVLSGPAAGVIGAQIAGAACGERRLITLDMGGTSTDIAVIDGAPALTREAHVAGLPLQLPLLAVHPVGAGGGSLAWVDPGGALQVGPASAGAAPGPACYGRGGTQATLTDADLVLGRLSVRRFLDGGLALDRQAALQALGTLGGRLGLSPLAAAAGVAQVAGAVVARAVRALSVDQGLDPAEFVLLPFGGAGALHAADLAQELGIPRVLVPPAPGLLSAYGALCARVLRERQRTLLRPAADAQRDDAVAAARRGLEEQVREDLVREAGAAAQTATLSWSADLRYQGQSHELTLPGDHEGDLTQRFVTEHTRRYGFTLPREVELVSLRVSGEVPLPEVPIAHLSHLGPAPSTQGQIDQIDMAFIDPPAQVRTYPTPVYDRLALRPGAALRGPALLLEYSATTVVPPGWRAEVHDSGALLLSLTP